MNKFERTLLELLNMLKTDYSNIKASNRKVLPIDSYKGTKMNSKGRFGKMSKRWPRQSKQISTLLSLITIDIIVE